MDFFTSVISLFLLYFLLHAVDFVSAVPTVLQQEERYGGCMSESRPNGLTTEEHIRLCSRDNETSTRDLGSEGRVQCFENLPNQLPKELKLKLCGSSDNPVAAAHCLIGASAYMSWKNSVELCLYANFGENEDELESSLLPVDCMLKAQGLISETNIVKLCKYNYYSAGLKCFRDTVHHIRLSQDSVIELCSGKADYHGPIECALKLRNKFRNEENILKLCRDGSNSSNVALVASCAEACPSKMKEGLCVSICIGSKSEAPAKCADRLLSRSTKGTKAALENDNGLISQLCRDSVSEEPATCFNHKKLQRLDPLDRVDVCKGATDTKGRLECYEKAPRDMSIKEKAKLCVGVSTVGPAQCIKDVKNVGFLRNQEKPFEDQIKICSKASTKEHVKLLLDCVKVIDRKGKKWETSLKVEISSNLCPKINEEESVTLPYECAEKALSWNKSGVRNRKGVSNFDISRVCDAANTAAPGQCFSALAPLLVLPFLAVEPCRNNHPVGVACCVNSFPSFRKKSVLKDNSLIKLCQNAKPDSCAFPSKCYLNAPNFLSEDEKVSLCSESENETPLACAIALPKSQLNSIGNELIVSLCKNAKTVTPLRCAIELKNIRRDVSSRQIFDLCSTSETMDTEINFAPVACMNHRAASMLKTEVLAVLCTGTVDLIGEEPHNCFSLAHRSVVSNLDRAILCSGSNSSAPAECAQHISRGNLSPLTKIRICKNSLDIGPAICANFMDSFEDMETVISLCSPAKNEIPAKCYKNLLKAGMSKKGALDTCKGAIAEATEECARSTLERTATTEPAMEEDHIAKLCSRVEWSDSGICAKNAPPKLNSSQVVELCKGSSEERADEPIYCFSAAPFRNVDYRIELCRGAPSELPLICARTAMEKLSVSDLSFIAKLCQAAESNIPVDCASILATSRLSNKVKLKLCVGAENDGPARCAIAAQFDIPSKHLVDLCEWSSSAAPADCVKSAPMYMPNQLKVKLCAGAESIAPASCVREATSVLSESDKVELCQSTISSMPALCANYCPYRIEKNVVVQLCKGAETLTPATCASFITSERFETTLSQSQVEYCRNAISTPHTFELQNATVQTIFIFNGKLVSAFSFNLIDQFGEHFQSEIPELEAVQIGIFEEGSNTTTLNSVYAVPFTGDNIVYKSIPDPECRDDLTEYNNTFQIENISISETGSYELVIIPKLTLTHTNINIKPLHLKLKSEMDDTVMLSRTRLCRYMPLQLQSIWDTTNKLGMEAEHETVISAILPPWMYIVLSKSCVKMLENEFELTITKTFISRRSLIVLVHHGPGKLISKVGVPTVDMNEFEVLGVAKNASKSEIKKAYYKESKKWHPDKWAKYDSIFQHQAQNVFELISDAYMKLKT